MEQQDHSRDHQRWSGEEIWLLKHHRDVFSEVLSPDIPDIHSADGYPAAALRYIVELVQKKHQRALSGTGSAEDAQGGSRRYLYIYILQYVMTLFIAEGCSDCWSLLSSGHKAIAIPSATLLTRKDSKLLEALSEEKGTRFAMYPDDDEPGEKLILQLQKVLPNLARYQLPAGCKDFSDLYLLKR